MTTTTTLGEKEFYDITVVMVVFYSFLVLVSQCTLMVSEQANIAKVLPLIKMVKLYVNRYYCC